MFLCFYQVAEFTLRPFIFDAQAEDQAMRGRGEQHRTFINHEQIHIAQACELGCLPMYMLWVFDFFKGLICLGRSRDPRVVPPRACCGCGCDSEASYVWNRLEQEALEHEADPEYLTTRRCCAWRSYPNAEVAQRTWSPV